MPTSVWSPGWPLPMSWRNVPTHQQVGPLDPVDHRGRDRRRLAQVPVDGEAVVGVALRLAAHRGPLGQDAHEQVALVERLDDVDGGRPGHEQLGEEVTGLVGPRRRHLRRGPARGGRGWPARRRAPVVAEATATRNRSSGSSAGAASAVIHTRSSRSTTCGNSWRSRAARQPAGPRRPEVTRSHTSSLVHEIAPGRRADGPHQLVGVGVAEARRPRRPGPRAAVGRRGGRRRGAARRARPTRRRGWPTGWRRRRPA